MRCGRCDHDNPDGSRFCLECGQPLTHACAGCGAALPAGAKFCNACGAPVGASGAAPRTGSPDAYTPRHLAERILTSRAAIEGERKAVTVLFCDLVGSTELAERLGPDAMHDLLNRFFDLALAEIHRYEGTVNQFLGDGFMALFGAPLAHEDHARRAVLAALGVAGAVAGRPLALASGDPVAVSVRMGINTGPVVVGAVGDNLRMDYTAVGDTTHLAARLQQAAGPGTLLLSESTARLVDDEVQLEPIGALELRGLSGRVPAYRLLGRSAPASAPGHGGRRERGRFVGRAREVATLAELFADVERGQGRVAGIVGEPGLGKSRLVLEFRETVAGRATCLSARCVSYGSAIPYLPVLDLLRELCGIADADTPEGAAGKVAAALAALDMSADRAPYLLRLLGLKEGEDGGAPEGGDVLAARTLDTLRQTWLRSSRRRPLVLIVEDLHWMDRASEACLAGLAEVLGGAAVLLLVTYRPGYQPPWMDRSYATQVSLAPLRRADSLDVIRSLLPGLDPEDPQARMILDKGEGNPFFLEELVQVVRDGDSGRLPVPDSVQGVLAARIDRLPASAKQTLQTASVLGRQFGERLLRAIAEAPERLDADLRELTRLEFLHERADADGRAYTFKHALTQEVAHASLLASRRRALHRAAGDALAALGPDRAADLAPVLAHHYLEAEAWAAAVEPARRAAETARRAWANSEALGRYDDALRAAARAGTPAAERRALLEARAEVHAGLGHFDPARADLEAGLGLAEEDGDVVAQGRLLAALGALWGGHRDYAHGLELTRRAVDLIGPTGNRRALAEARVQLGIMLLNLVRMTDSRRELEAALALFDEIGDRLNSGRTRETLAMNLQLSGDLPAAAAVLPRALADLETAGDRRTQIVAFLSLSSTVGWVEGLRPILTTLERAIELARELEAASDEALVRAALAEFAGVFGMHAHAFREATTALRIARELGHLEWTVYALAGLCRVHAECGQLARARELADEELALARRLGAPLWIADALSNVGHVLMLGGEVEAPRRHFEEAVRTAGECVEKVILPLLHLGDLELRAGRPAEALRVVERFRTTAPAYLLLLSEARRIEGEAWTVLGRHADAEVALREAMAAAEPAEMLALRARAGLGLAEMLAGRGRVEEARREAAAVRSLLERMAAELPPDLAHSFRGAEAMRRAWRLTGY